MRATERFVCGSSLLNQQRQRDDRDARHKDHSRRPTVSIENEDRNGSERRKDQPTHQIEGEIHLVEVRTNSGDG